MISLSTVKTAASLLVPHLVAHHTLYDVPHLVAHKLRVIFPTYIRDAGTWARPATPQMQKAGDEWISKGCKELEYKACVFRAVSRPPLKHAATAALALSLLPI